MQNMLRDGCYLRFYDNLREKNCLYNLKLCRKIGQSLEESLRGGKVVNILNE